MRCYGFTQFMKSSPRIFIAAASKELKTARQLVANALLFLGYDPVWEDIFGTEQGDLRAMLRKKIDQSQGVVQLVGQCYGVEPSMADEQFGRVSYTQYEALYARQQGKKVWYFLLDPNFPADSHAVESQELHGLQASYRGRIERDSFLSYSINSSESLKAKVLELRGELAELRTDRYRVVYTVLAILIVICVVVLWQVVNKNLGPPSDISTKFTAERLFDAKDYAAAFHFYAELSDQNLGDLELHRRIEECARLGHLEPRFLERYLALVRTRPTNAVFRNYLGNAYLMLDPHDQDGKARECYETATKLEANFASPLINLGIIEFRHTNFTEAEKLFEKYLEFAPDDAVGWFNLGHLHVTRMEREIDRDQLAENAERILKHALTLRPSFDRPYKWLGTLYALTGRTNEALHAYQESLALNYDQHDVRQQYDDLLASLYGQGAFQGNRSDDLLTRSFSPDDPTEILVLAAMKALEKGDTRRVEELSREVESRQPTNRLSARLIKEAAKVGSNTVKTMHSESP